MAELPLTPLHPDISANVTAVSNAPVTFRSGLNTNIGLVEDKAQNAFAAIEKLQDALGNGCLSGGDLHAGTGLSVHAAALTALVGTWVGFDAEQTIGGLTDSATNYIFLRQDGTWTINTTGADPTDTSTHGAFLLWGTCACTGGQAGTPVNTRNTFMNLGSKNLTTTGTLTAGEVDISNNLVVSRDTGEGIKLYPASPVWGWRDLLSTIHARTAGGVGSTAIPDFVEYRSGLFSYRFGTLAPNNHTHETFTEFHLPHDYVPGTDIYIHVHWSQIVADTGGAASAPGVAKWYFDISYADGYGTAGSTGDPFVAPKTISVTQQASTTQYAHMIAEVIISGAADDSTHFLRTKFKVDGLFLVRLYRDPTDNADTLNQDTFVHYVDMHYQTNGVMGTYNKNTPFYSGP